MKSNLLLAVGVPPDCYLSEDICCFMENWSLLIRFFDYVFTPAPYLMFLSLFFEIGIVACI